LQFTQFGRTVEEIEEQLTGVVAGEWLDMEHGRWGYTKGRRCASGAAEILSTPGREDMHVVLPGKWCQAVGKLVMQGLISWLLAAGQVTRCDIAGDDYSRRKSPAQVWAYVMKGDVSTRTRAGRIIHDRRGGSTCYIGAPGSRVMLRVYDKFIESKGAINAVRWELELHGEAAQFAVRDIYRGKSWGHVWASTLRRLVEFKVRREGGTVTRLPVMAWFADLVGDVAKAASYLTVRPVLSAVDRLRWLRKQVAPSMAAIVAAGGGSLEPLYHFLTEGKARWGVSHRLIVAQGVVW
jgi:DNA relaxase NicK